MLPLLLLPISMLAVAFIPLNVWYLIKASKVAKMDAAYMPVVCENMEQLQKVIRDAEQKQEAPTQPEGGVYTPPAASGWVCTCGRNHAAYEASCVCGMTKAGAKAQNTQN